MKASHDEWNTYIEKQMPALQPQRTTLTKRLNGSSLCAKGIPTDWITPIESVIVNKLKQLIFSTFTEDVLSSKYE